MLVLMAATASAQESTPAVELVGPTVPAYDQPAEVGFRSGELKTPALLYGACALADLATTEYALGLGAYESNPIMRRRGIRLGMELGVVAGTTWIDRWAQRRAGNRAMWVFRGVLVGATGALAVHNIRVGHEVRP